MIQHFYTAERGRQYYLNLDTIKQAYNTNDGRGRGIRYILTTARDLRHLTAEAVYSGYTWEEVIQ